MREHGGLVEVGAHSAFERLLVALWLRPERALWDAFEIATLSRMLKGRSLNLSLEYGCTEGTNTVVLLGGQFKPDYDDYRDLPLRGDAGTRPGDAFSELGDLDPNAADLAVVPAVRITRAVGWREAHVLRSRRWGIYGSVSLAPLNQPLLDVAEGACSTIWSPNLFWTDPRSFERLLADHRRILSAKGSIFLLVPDAAQGMHFFTKGFEARFPNWFERVDRGLFENSTKNAKSQGDWEGLFARNGLRVEACARLIHPKVSYVYQLGFRSVFAPLLTAYQGLRRGAGGALQEIKAEWIATALDLCEPLFDQAAEGRGEGLWFIFELRST